MNKPLVIIAVVVGLLVAGFWVGRSAISWRARAAVNAKIKNAEERAAEIAGVLAADQAFAEVNVEGTTDGRVYVDGVVPSIDKLDELRRTAETDAAGILVQFSVYGPPRGDVPFEFAMMGELDGDPATDDAGLISRPEDR